MEMRVRIAILIGLLSVACAPERGSTWDGQVQAHGAFRAMLHEGKIGPVVGLESMLPNPDLYAVGALADLAGEITVLGGKAYLSYPDHTEEARTELHTRSDAQATLLVSSRVPVWTSYTTERAIRFQDLDEEIARIASSAGMSLEGRFPFLLKGSFDDLRWHVIDGRRLEGGGESHHEHMAAAVRMARDRTRATLVGFYSRSDQGVFTHMDTATHVHCVVEDPLSAGHVDHVEIPAGATIEFPLLSER